MNFFNWFPRNWNLLNVIYWFILNKPPKEINLDDIDLNQLPNEIPYVMISGIVVPVQEELKSESNNRGGVIQVIEVKERYRTYKQDEKEWVSEYICWLLLTCINFIEF